MPVRYIIVVLMFFGMLNSYLMRVILSVSIVAMVNKTEKATYSGLTNEKACPELMQKRQNLSLTSLASEEMEEHWSFNWDIETQSLILSAFFYGYVISQMPAGFILKRFGAKWYFGIGILICSILTLITPQVANLGAVPMIVLRVAQGLTQGALYPATSVLVAHWVPLCERCRCFTFVYTGTAVGTVVAMSISGAIADSAFLKGWPATFYLCGAFGCGWFLLWAIFVHESPEVHPWISEKEKDSIIHNQPHLDEKPTNIPWVSILTSVPVWSLNIALFGDLWGIYTLTTEMPTYFANIFHMDISTNGYLSAMPYVVQVSVGLLTSYIADKLQERKIFTVNTLRKLMNSIAFFGAGACLLLLTIVGCNTTWSVALIGIAMALKGFVFAGCEIVVVDMSPSYTGALTTIVNTFGNIAGLLAPFVVGRITRTGHTVENWNYVFIISAALYFVTGIIFDIFGSANEQSWSCEKSVEKPVEGIHCKDAVSGERAVNDNIYDSSKL